MIYDLVHGQRADTPRWDSRLGIVDSLITNIAMNTEHDGTRYQISMLRYNAKDDHGNMFRHSVLKSLKDMEWLIKQH